MQEVGYVVMNAVTSLLAEDPEGAAAGVMAANRAWSEGAIRHALATHGSWRTIVTINGEAIPVVVVKDASGGEFQRG